MTEGGPATVVEPVDGITSEPHRGEGVTGRSAHCGREHHGPATGSEDRYRLRIGDYRVIYEIMDEQLVILVVGVGYRRENYRAMS
jgi:ParE toxin of type II toxin-antitoxin system, parDE